MNSDQAHSFFVTILDDIARGKTLERGEARQAIQYIMAGEATHAQVGAFLLGLRQRGETPQELTGAAEGMRSAAIPLETTRKPLVDTCGTGGDGAGTFNISTASAFVVAGAGVGVAKHGNRSISSACGSADVLEAFGARTDLNPAESSRCLEETGFGFLFAPHYHPAARHAAPVRRDLGIRTLFNLLGPLCNPAPVTHQVMGIFAPELRSTAAKVLSLLGLEGALVVHGHGGLDEIALSGPTLATAWMNGSMVDIEIEPIDLGLSRAPVEALAGGDADENAGIIRRIFDGERGAPRDVVCLNAGACLWVSGVAGSLNEGLAAAQASVDSGKAGQALSSFVSFTRSAGS